MWQSASWGTCEARIEYRYTVPVQAALNPLLPDQGGSDAVDGEGNGGRSFGDRVFGNPLGKGEE